MAGETKRNFTGVVLAVAILLVMGAAVAIALDVPLSKTFSFPSVPAAGAQHQVNITLWADAAGWNYNHGKVNPVIVIPVGTLVQFTVVEEDNQPHTLTFAPGAQEASAHATLLGTSDITTTPGHVSHTSAYFSTAGEYTYWCLIHPTTMVGQLYVNASASVPTNNTNTQHSYSHFYNTSMEMNNSRLQIGSTPFPAIYIKNGTFLNFTVNNTVNAHPSTYSLNFSYGRGVNQSNSTTLIGSTNLTGSGGFYFVKPGLYSYWNYYNESSYGLIYVYVSTAKQTLYASLQGWNYSKGTLNPTLHFSQYTLVNFTVINLDNLSHSLIINPGTSSNSSYTPIANVTSGVSNASATVFFSSSGNYTYWDMYHPTTAIGLVLVTAINTSAGGNSYFQPDMPVNVNGNSDISVNNMLSSHYFEVRMEN